MGAGVNAYTLRGLKGDTEYVVQVSGVTGAGEGAPSRARLFTAAEHQGPHCTFIAYRDRLHPYELPSPHTGSSGVPGPVIMAIVFVTVTLTFGTLVLERYDACLT